MSFETQQDAAATICNEDLAYAVQDYCAPSRFADDPKLEQLWRDAARACNRLETYLAPFGSGDLVDRTIGIARLEEEE